MRHPPATAAFLLDRLGPRDQSLAGDLHEEYAAGRSNLWFWRQTMAVIACGAIAETRRTPRRSAGAIATGWAVVATVFLLGDRIADGIAGSVWGWSRQTAYVDDVWWPFYIGALAVTYGGFGLSATVVGWINRHQPSALVAYVGSAVVALVAAGVVMEFLILSFARVPVPHPLFYAVSTTLRFQWYSGILLVPLTMLLCGTIAVRRPVRVQ